MKNVKIILLAIIMISSFLGCNNGPSPATLKSKEASSNENVANEYIQDAMRSHMDMYKDDKLISEIDRNYIKIEGVWTSKLSAKVIRECNYLLPKSSNNCLGLICQNENYETFLNDEAFFTLKNFLLSKDRSEFELLQEYDANELLFSIKNEVRKIPLNTKDVMLLFPVQKAVIVTMNSEYYYKASKLEMRKNINMN